MITVSMIIKTEINVNWLFVSIRLELMLIQDGFENKNKRLGFFL